MTFEDWAAHLGFTREVRAWLHEATPAEARRALEHYQAEAKRRYRVYARRLHPDLGGDEAELKMLNAAWDVIRELEIHEPSSPPPPAPPPPADWIEPLSAEVGQPQRIVIVGNEIKINY